MRLFSFALAMMVWSAGAAVADQPVIGEALEVVNKVQVIYDSDDRTLRIADDLHRLETVKAKRDSAAKLQFTDGTTVSLGPQSEVVLDDFVYAGDVADNAILRVTKGTIRFVSGQIDKEGVEIRTPAATIGIRGTNFAVVVRDKTTHLVMDRAGAAIVQGTCVGLEGVALDACRVPVTAETGKAFTIREGQAPQLAQDLISIMGDVGRIADVEWLRRFSSTARKVMATINRMDGMLGDGTAAPASSPRSPSSPGDIDIPFDLF